MATYRVKLTDGTAFAMQADMIQAAAPLRADFSGEDEWQNTPYQTADAGHDLDRAAVLVAHYFGAGADEGTEVESVTAE